jgi:hypothetical protein
VPDEADPATLPSVWVLTRSDAEGTSVIRADADYEDALAEAEHDGEAPLTWVEGRRRDGELRFLEAFDEEEPRWRVEAFPVWPPGTAPLAVGWDPVREIRGDPAGEEGRPCRRRAAPAAAGPAATPPSSAASP